MQAIQNIGGTIGSINEITTAIAAAVEEQGSATQEIARNVQETAKGTSALSGNIGVVTRGCRRNRRGRRPGPDLGRGAQQAGGDAPDQGRQLPGQHPRRVRLAALGPFHHLADADNSNVRGAPRIT